MTAFYWIHFSSTFSRVASSLLFFRVLSLLVVYKLSDLSFFNVWEWDWLGFSLFFGAWVFSKGVALHKSNSWMDALPSLLFFLHWLRSYPSWCFLRGRWEPILFSMDFLWKLFLQAACAQLRDFFSRFQRHLFSIFGYTSSCFAASVCSCNTSLGGFIVFASSFQMQTCPVLKGFLCGCATD